MSCIIHCRTKEREYPIHIGSGFLKEIAALPGRKFLVYDENVPRPALPVDDTFALPSGEVNKTLATVERICRTAAQKGFRRGDTFVALGGGVTSDLTGFASAIYMRGVNFAAVPTTLLAMADASVGGKTGADLPEGKNLVGAFHQPLAVWIDTDFLKTLPLCELQSGLAEVIKTAVIRDGSFFRDLEKAGGSLVEDPDFSGIYTSIAEKCCRIKADVVALDEQEHGLRAILNYGHTFGHAVESWSSYTVSHGAGVAIGMNIAAVLNEKSGRWPESETLRQRQLLKAAGLPVNIPAKADCRELLKRMYSDKKCDSSGLRIVLPGSVIGSAELCSGIPEQTILEAMEACHD